MIQFPIILFTNKESLLVSFLYTTKEQKKTSSQKSKKIWG